MSLDGEISMSSEAPDFQKPLEDVEYEDQVIENDEAQNLKVGAFEYDWDINSEIEQFLISRQGVTKSYLWLFGPLKNELSESACINGSYKMVY